MPEYDLTNKVAEHLDRHMIFPLLEFLSSRKIYDDKSILAMKLELLTKTNMVDFAVDCYKNLNSEDEIPERKLTTIPFYGYFIINKLFLKRFK